MIDMKKMVKMGKLIRKISISTILFMFSIIYIEIFLTWAVWEKFDLWYLKIAIITIDIFGAKLAYAVQKFFLQPHTRFIIEDVPISKIVELIGHLGMIEGSHHKQWILDQILRICLKTDEAYNAWIEKFNSEDNDENWDSGISP